MRMRKGFSDPPGRFDGAPKQKRAVNLSVDAEILGVAREMNINLSQTLEDALRKRTQDERVRRFREENREAIESYNALIERAGIFGEEWREW